MLENWTDACQLVSRVIAAQNDLYSKREWEKKLLLLLYGIVILGGILGNILIIVIISRTPRLRNFRNYFIMHLACSDLLMCLLTAPMTLYLTLYNFWELGDVTCKVVASIQALNTLVSSLTLTAIALDRYLLVIFPVSWRSQKNALIVILTLVWVLAVVITAPYLFAVGTTEANNEPWTDIIFSTLLQACGETVPSLCVEKFEHTHSWFDKRTFTILIFVLQYIFPLSAIFFVYWHIGRTALNRGNDLATRREMRREQKRAKKKKRTMILLTSLVTVFGVCWFPSNLYCTLDALKVIVFQQKTYIYFHLIGMVTSLLNPLLYGFLNANLQKVMVQLFRPMRYLFSVTATSIRRQPISVHQNRMNRMDELRSETQTPTATESNITYLRGTSKVQSSPSLLSRQRSLTRFGTFKMDSLDLTPGTPPVLMKVLEESEEESSRSRMSFVVNKEQPH